MNGICSNNSHTRSALYLESPLLLLRCRPATAWNSRIPFTKQSVLEGGDLCDPRTAVEFRHSGKEWIVVAQSSFVIHKCSHNNVKTFLNPELSGLRYEDGPTVSSCSSSLLLHSSLLSEVLALNSSAWWSTIGNETGVIYSVFFYRVVCDSLLAALVSFIFVSLYVSLKSVDMIRFSR